MLSRRIPLTLALVVLALAQGLRADVALHPLFSDHMVLQRDRATPIYGTAGPAEKVTVTFAGQSTSAVADARGQWIALLKPMAANATGQSLTVAGANTLTISDVVVGDVWLCSGQSNMDMRLGGCGRPGDMSSADFPGIRTFWSPMLATPKPQKTVRGDWMVCTPASASRFSATAFYFARKIYQDQQAKVPIGLLMATVGGTRIDAWLAPEGVIGNPVIEPILKDGANPGGPFSLFNGMVFPLAPYAIKGAIWYQGENSEMTTQSPDSYYLKMKALQQGWKRLWGMNDFPFYFVLIANWGPLPKSATPEIKPVGGWDSDTRLQQVNALSLPHAGMGSALDIGESNDWHPRDKADVGERLALCALKNDYGRTDLVAAGPRLKDVAVEGSSLVCTFSDLGGGLMVGLKKPYEPTKEVPNGKLNRFVIAGEKGDWHAATAIIKGDTVVVSAPEVPAPRKVAYACWQNPLDCNLYNKAGLPAAPFLVEDVTRHYTIAASAGAGGRISPEGKQSLLQRTTTLYTITPDAGHAIADVKVDGISVGAVRHYTFDPVYANHTIEATFASADPMYTITATATGGGTLSGVGASRVPQGQSITYAIAPTGENQVEVIVDGISLGERSAVTFADVRANHTINVKFSATINTSAGFGGLIFPEGPLAVAFGGNPEFAIKPLDGYALAALKVDGADVPPASSYTFKDVTASHSIAATFKPSAPIPAGSIPNKDQLLFACLAESLPAKGPANWPALVPADKKFSAIGTPIIETIDGHRYAGVSYQTADGFAVGSYNEPIPCTGATIVAVAKPTRNGAGSGWTSIVDVFYDRLVLGIRNDSGQICIRRNGPIDVSPKPIPSGQVTILSLVVQPDGSYKVYANGVEAMSVASNGPLNDLKPGVPGPFARSITIGRNAPDAWTGFNGCIGDCFLYKTALTPQERQDLEHYLAKKLTTPAEK